MWSKNILPWTNFNIILHDFINIKNGWLSEKTMLKFFVRSVSSFFSQRALLEPVVVVVGIDRFSLFSSYRAIMSHFQIFENLFKKLHGTLCNYKIWHFYFSSLIIEDLSTVELLG